MEIKLTKSKQTFHFKPSINLGVDSNWMIGLTSLEVYNSIFNITETNNKFVLYTDTYNEFSFVESKDELEEILDISNIRDNQLEVEILGPRIMNAYEKLETEKRQTGGYYMLLMGYAQFSLWRF